MKVVQRQHHLLREFVKSSPLIDMRGQLNSLFRSKYWNGQRFLHTQSMKEHTTLLLSYNQDCSLATVVLNRPKKKNAFSKVMYNELDTTLRVLSGDKRVKVILLTGAGDNYSSGNDLSNFSELMHPLTIAKQSREICYSFVDSFITCEKPIIVAVNGPAFGIAVTVLGLCDSVFSSSSATYKTPFAELGQVSLIATDAYK